MNIRLFSRRKSESKFHIDDPALICNPGYDVKVRYEGRLRIREAEVDMDETLSTGNLYIRLPEESISWWRADEVCRNCELHLLRKIFREAGKDLYKLRRELWG